MALFCDMDTYSGLSSSASPRPTYPAQWLSFVKDIKLLYFSHQYKRCASQCEKILQDEVDTLHPLHESFLHFYVAVCNESLGLAAHRFSAKKLSYLHLAKDAFTAASASLPLPYKSDDIGSSEAISHSSQIDHFDLIDDERSEVFPSSCTTPDIKQSLHDRCDSGYDSESEPRSAGSENIPDFKRYSARQPFKSLTSDETSEHQSSSHVQNTTNTKLNDPKLRPTPLSIKKRTFDLQPSTSIVQQPHLSPIEYQPGRLTHRQQLAITQLKAYFEQLQNIRLSTSDWIGSYDNGPVYDHQLNNGFPCGPFTSVSQFHDFLVAPVMQCPQPELTVKYRKQLSDDYPINFTHADLSYKHIFVDKVNGNVTGIIDWEMAGFFPGWWEYRKALYGSRQQRWWIDLVNRVMPCYGKELEVDSDLEAF